jgi:hypothetical protein
LFFEVLRDCHELFALVQGGGNPRDGRLQDGLAASFFWGLFLTLTGQFWAPFYLSGLLVTVAKEFLDLWSKRHWCWIDFACGCGGCLAALALL